MTEIKNLLFSYWKWLIGALCIIALLILWPYGIQKWIPLILFIGYIFFYNLTEYKLIKRQKINWNNHKDLTKVSRVLHYITIFTTFYIGTAIYYLIIGESLYELNFIILLILFCIYSVWVYVSYTLVKPNAILLLRSYTIFSFIGFGWLLFKFIGEIPSEIVLSSISLSFDVVMETFSFILFIGFLALAIKGIIISFSQNIRNVFTNQRIRYIDLTGICFIITSIVILLNIKIEL